MSFDENINLLLAQANINDRVENIEALTTGGNNRAYKILAGKEKFIVKQYFKHNDDRRDRLESELSFLAYAQQVSPQFVPKLVAKRKEEGLALYEYVDGVSFSAEQIGWQQVKNAANFFVALNQNRIMASALPAASEACFSIFDHLSLIHLRILELQNLEVRCEEDKKAIQFIKELRETFTNIEKKIKAEAHSLKHDIFEALGNEQRCISPSDFGFHNALLTKNGAPKFIDFEYAGWDDPAKMAGDFFSQLAVPVPGQFFDDFVKLSMSPFPLSEQLEIRAHLLRPAYKIKWCCIAMNIFLPVNLTRRKFANPLINEAELKSSQLNKAMKQLQLVGRN